MLPFDRDILAAIAKDVLAAGTGKVPSPIPMNEKDVIAWSGVVSIDVKKEQGNVSVYVSRQKLSPGLKDDHTERGAIYNELDQAIETIKQKILLGELTPNDPLFYRTGAGYWVEANLLPTGYLLLKISKAEDYQQSEMPVQETAPEPTTEDQYNDPNLREIAYNRLKSEGFSDNEIDEPDLRHVIDLILQEK
jgi:hypothetical protein